MSSSTNPFFELVDRAENEELSKDHLEELACSGDFLGKIDFPEHYNELLFRYRDSFYGMKGPPCPRWIIAFSLQVALKLALPERLILRLHVSNALMCVHQLDFEEATKSFVAARNISHNLGEDRVCLLLDILTFLSDRRPGIKLLTQERIASISNTLKEAVKKPHDFFITCCHALFLLLRGDIGEAVEYMESYGFEISVSEDQPKVQFTVLWLLAYGLACDLSGRYEASLSAFKICRNLMDSSEIKALLPLVTMFEAKVLSSAGQLGKASQVLESAREESERGESLLLRFFISLERLHVGSVMGEPAIETFRSEQLSGLVHSKGLEFALVECLKGLAHAHRIQGRPEQALGFFRQAMDICVESDMVVQLAECKAEMAIARVDLGDLEEGFAGFQQALGMTHRVNTIRYILIYFYLLGYTREKREEYHEAIRAYAEAIDIIESLRADLRLLDRRKGFLEQRYWPFHGAIDCCLKLGDYGKALEYVERLKARILVEMLEERARPKSGMASEESAVVAKERIRRSPLLSSDFEELNVGAVKSHTDVHSDSDQTLGNSAELELGYHLDFSIQDQISVEEFSALNTEPSAAVIELFPMPGRTVAFILSPSTAGNITTVFIPEYDRSALVQDLEDIRNRDKMERVLERLYEKLFSPLVSHLRGVTKLTFIPYSEFHLIPLHAMFRQENGTRKYLLDDYRVTYAPSAKILRRCVNKADSKQHEGCVAWANPNRDLPFARREAEAIATSCDWKILPAVTRNEIIEEGYAAGVLHYSGHADGNALLLHNGGVMDGEDRLNTRDIFTRLDLQGASLVTLSACDTGKVSLGMTDEYIGLPSAFLHAGASTVICSLWSVSDVSTTLLMVKMYQLIKKGLGKAEALRQAQLWLKNPDNREEHHQELEKLLPWLSPAEGKSLPDTTRFGRTRLSAKKFLPQDLSHPYHWAGFVCSGAP